MRSWPSNNLLRHPWFAPVLLVAIILAVYYPAVSNGIHPVDDPGIFAFYSSSPSISSILLPGNGYYYRPFIALSFYLDNLLWGMEPGTMHLENILLHCANSLLVYSLGRRISSDDEIPFIPLFAALLFALHPVNVEAVAWIAGRTDPLLALFVLSSSYFWLRWLDKPLWRNIVAALLLFGAALLTKETALAFGAVVVLLLLIWPGTATKRQRLMVVVIMVASGALPVIFALMFMGGASGLNRFLSSGTDLLVSQGVWQAATAFGFYVSKLMDPFPLNFAIYDVHPMFALLGIAFFPFLWWLFRRYQLSSVLFTSAALLILPAILIAVKQVAWTPFAERYLYLSTAFLALGMIGICEVCQKKHRIILVAFFVILLCGSALSSFQRNLLWKDSLSFFQDTVTKSPKFGSVYYSLGGLLMQKGKIDQAEEAFAAADRLNQRVSMRYPIKLSVMGIMLAKGRYLEVRTYFFQLFKSKRDAPADFLELLYKADSKRLGLVGEKGNLLQIHDLLETLELLYVKSSDPFWLYRSGQMSQAIGNNARAADFFHKAYSAAPVDAHYRPAAQKLFQKLESSK